MYPRHLLPIFGRLVAYNNEKEILLLKEWRWGCWYRTFNKENLLKYSLFVGESTSRKGEANIGIAYKNAIIAVLQKEKEE